METQTLSSIERLLADAIALDESRAAAQIAIPDPTGSILITIAIVTVVVIVALGVQRWARS